MEERIWLRTRWTKQFAMVDSSGVFRISCSSAFDKLTYDLNGANVVLIQGDSGNSATTISSTVIEIQIKKGLPFSEGRPKLTFRPLSVEELAQWICTLNRLCTKRRE